MDKNKIVKEFAVAVEKGIKNFIATNPDKINKIDWFTMLAKENIEISELAEQKKVTV